ncbi:MAG: hypothetical protein AAFZ09_18955 [Pseudomonadota bacterium]
MLTAPCIRLSAGRSVEADQALAPYIDPGETLVWSGRPMMRPLVEGHEIILPLVNLLLAGAVFQALGTGIVEGVAGRTEPMRALLFSMMVAFVALAVWSPVRTILRRRRSYYGVTNRRAMLLETGPGGAFRSFPLSWDQIVNVRFGARVSVIFESTRAAPFEREVGFEQLSDGMAVYRLIRQIQSQNAPSR